MRDQDIDLACLADEDGDLRPMRLRYGVTAEEATHREPLDLALREEEAELTLGEEGTWDDIDVEPPRVMRNHPSVLPDDLDEEQVATAAEHDAMREI